MVGKIRGDSATAAQQAQQAEQAGATGALGGRTVRQGRNPFAAVRNALSRVADYISAGFKNFKSLFSRSVRRGEAGEARVAATRVATAPEQVEEARGRLSLEQKGTVSVDVASIGDMFEYVSDKETGLAEQALKDFPRTDYVIGGKTMDYDTARSVQALRDLATDENGQADEKMALAVSQVAHQGLFFDGESKITLGLLHDHGVIPVGQGDDSKRIKIERLDNGDVRIDIEARKDMKTVVGSDGKTHIHLKEGSFYEYSMSVTVHAGSVAGGHPAVVEAAPLRYAYSLGEQ